MHGIPDRDFRSPRRKPIKKRVTWGILFRLDLSDKLKL